MLDYRVTSQGTAHYPPGATFGPRRMNEYEFVYIVKGDCQYTIDDKTFDLPEGGLALCVPGTIDSFTWDAKKPTVHSYFHFDISTKDDALGPASHWRRVLVPTQTDILVPLFQHVMAWAGRDEHTTAQSLRLLLRSFLLDQAATHQEQIDAMPPAIEAALRLIFSSLDHTPAKPPTFEDIVQASCVSKEHLCRLFSKHMGYSPMKTLMLARLDRAMGLVARSNFSVKQIAAAMGFATPYHFSRSFTQAFGHSPQQLRASVQQGQNPPLPRLIKVLRQSTPAPRPAPPD
jgi:AraC family transcriptional regulator